MNSEKKLYEIAVKTKLKHYESPPPTIMEFLSNPYYLGEETQEGKRVFPYWKTKLQEIYPTPFFEYSPDKKIIILTGATGIGKCHSGETEIEVYMSEEDIKKYGLEDYIQKSIKNNKIY